MAEPRRPTLDLNCDLGEGEPVARTRALMRWITSANVACGGHAGDADSMGRCVRLAKQFDVKLGAHPGPWSRSDMGRGDVRMTPAELTLLVLQQVSALEKIAAGERVRVHHVKLHGALYHAVEADAALRGAYLRCVATYWPRAAIYALAGGRAVRDARRLGLRCLAEGFADRAYQADGRLVPRSERGAVISDVAAIVARAHDLTDGRGVTTVNGGRIHPHVDTLCVHSDSPNAVRIVRAIAHLI